MRLKLTTRIAAPTATVIAHVKTSRLLRHVAAPLVIFRPIGGEWPEVWAEGRSRAWMFLFGVLPIGRQWLGISFPEPPPGGFAVRDLGAGDMIRVWDHLITITPDGADATRYTDALEIKAGLLTPFVWLFALWFYSHRQSRWRALARRGFAY